MSRATTLILAAAGLVFLSGGVGFAETTVKPKGNADVRTERIQFDDELVEGELNKPELFYLLQKKQFNYKRLIKLRENFLPEMRRDAEKIPVGRAGR
jgi:hypothetical protein